MGSSGGLSHDVAEKIANYNSFFSTENADVLCLQEFTEYIDSNQQYNSDTAIFNNWFSYSSYTERETVIKSKTSFSSSAFSYLHTSGDPSAWCIYGSTTINGKIVFLVSGVLNVTANTEEKLRALDKLVNTICAGRTNVIIGMDTNALSKTEADAMRDYMAGYGFSSANWSNFGYLETYNLSSTGYRCIDNIFTRGNFEIVNFTVPSVYADLSSDHFPVVADLLMDY